MTTTFEKFAGQQARNYSTLPTIDVEIITAEHPAPRGYPTCQYCGTTDAEYVTSHQYSWYDAVVCTRCGGVTGWPIGD